MLKFVLVVFVFMKEEVSVNDCGRGREGVGEERRRFEIVVSGFGEIFICIRVGVWLIRVIVIVSVNIC